MSKRIIAVFMTFVILLSCCFVPASAGVVDGVEYIATQFWDFLTFKDNDTGALYWRNLLSEFLDDGVNINETKPEDWKKAYDKYTGEHVQSTLGTTQVATDGYLVSLPVDSYRLTNAVIDKINLGFVVSGAARTGDSYSHIYFDSKGFIAPVSGYYSCRYSFELTNCTFYSSMQTPLHFSAGSSVFHGEFLICSIGNEVKDDIYSFVGRCYMYIQPDLYSVNEFTQNIGGVDSRVGSITGDYGIIGDNGTIIKSDTQYIINETNNTYTNPATGETTTITNWTYDYSDRSYTCITDSGNTTTIIYGDEYVTINEGDTVYNIYYIIDGSGGGENPPDPSHKHEYTSAVTTAPACTTAGLRTYTCSCGDAYTEKIPATGHTWIIKEAVNTQYGENGELVTQGYTIYRCSVCGEEYKSTDGTAPPGGGSDSSGGNIWDKLGKLIGSLINGVLSVIEGVFSKVLDGLVAMVDMLTERFNALVAGILNIFDSIPAIFTGFLGFLGAVFAFLPEELILVLQFGFIAVIFVGLLLMILKR